MVSGCNKTEQSTTKHTDLHHQLTTQSTTKPFDLHIQSRTSSAAVAAAAAAAAAKNDYTRTTRMTVGVRRLQKEEEEGPSTAVDTTT